MADTYRDRRVFLLGDAAHVHSAAGGPGLSLALQDAVNLAWKLAADLHGWAPDGLLDTYESERQPLGQRVFMQTQAQTALMAPGPDVTALRELFGELLTDTGTVQRLADLLAGSDVRYDMGRADPDGATGWFAPSIEVDLATERPSGFPSCSAAAVRLCSTRPASSVASSLHGWIASTTSPWPVAVKPRPSSSGPTGTSPGRVRTPRASARPCWPGSAPRPRTPRARIRSAHGLTD